LVVLCTEPESPGPTLCDDWEDLKLFEYSFDFEGAPVPCGLSGTILFSKTFEDYLLNSGPELYSLYDSCSKEDE